MAQSPAYVFRSDSDTENPQLARLYDVGITRGLDVIVKKNHTGTRPAGITILNEGARFAGDTASQGLRQMSFRGFIIPEFENGVRNWRYHDGRLTAIPDFKTLTAVDASTNTFTSPAHGYSNGVSTADAVKIIAEGPASTNPKVPAGLTDEKIKYYIVNATVNTFQLALTPGGAAVDITDAGAGTLRVYRANAGFDDPQQGRPEFFPDLDFTLSGISYVEWIMPQRFATETSFDDLRFICLGKKVRDFAFDASDLITLGAEVDGGNPVLEVLDILINDAKLPLRFNHLGVDVPRFRGASWKALQNRCDALISWTGGNGTAGVASWITNTNWTISAETGALSKGITGDFARAFTRSIATTELDFSIDCAIHVGQGKIGFHVNNTDANPAPTLGILWAIDGKLYKVVGITTTQIGTWSPGDRIKIASENRVWKAYQNDVPLSIGVALVPNSTLYAFAEGDPNSQVLISQSLFAPLGTTGIPRQIPRFRSRVVFPTATLAQTAVETVFARMPGSEFQDVNGGLKALPDPVRAEVFTFKYEADRDDSNIIEAGVTVSQRPVEETPNFFRGVGRDADDLQLKQFPFQEDRKDFRESLPGAPLIDSGLLNYGVCNQSEANRRVKTEARLGTDLSIFANIAAFFDSYHCARGDYVKVADDVPGYDLDHAVLFSVNEEESKFETVPSREFLLQVITTNVYSDADGGLAVPTIPEVDASYLRPAPILTSLSLSQTNQLLPDGSIVNTVEGLATFQPFADQRGRVYWQRPTTEIFHFLLDSSTDVFTCDRAHPFADGDRVCLIENLSGFPGPAFEGPVYYVINSTATEFQLSLLIAGSALNFASGFDGFVHGESDWLPQSSVVIPNATNTGTFELLPAAFGVHRVKVVTENRFGIYFPFDAHLEAVMRVNIYGVAPEPPPSGRSLFDGLTVTFQFDPSPSQFVSGYRVTDGTNRVVRDFITSREWTETFTGEVMTRRVYAISSSGATMSTSFLELRFVKPPVMVWQNIVGAVIQTDGSLLKTASTGWGNCGAMLSQAILSNGVGARLGYSADTTNQFKIFGVSTSQNIDDIADFDYSIYLLNNGTVQARWNHNVNSQFLGTYTTGDKFFLQLQERASDGSGVVKVFKRAFGSSVDVELFQFPAASLLFPYYVGVALYDTATVFQPTLDLEAILTPLDDEIPVFNDLDANVSYDQTTGVLSHIATSSGIANVIPILGGDAGFPNFLVEDGAVSFKVATTVNCEVDLALAQRPMPFGFDYLGLAFASGSANVIESGGTVAALGAYLATDKWTISRENGTGVVRKNGALQYISPSLPATNWNTMQLVLAVEFFAVGGSVNEIRLKKAQGSFNLDGVNLVAHRASLENPVVGKNSVQTIPEFALESSVAGQKLALDTLKRVIAITDDTTQTISDFYADGANNISGFISLTDLFISSVEADALSRDGDKVEGFYFLDLTTTNSKSIVLSAFGDDILVDSAFTGVVGVAEVRFYLMRVSSSVLRCGVTVSRPAVTKSAFTEITGVDFTAIQQIVLKGDGVANGDVVARFGSVRLVKAP